MNNQSDTVLRVEGMSCGSCVRHVTSALNELEGVKKVEVKLRDGLVIVRHDPSLATIPNLIDALVEAGYPSTEQKAQRGQS